MLAKRERVNRSEFSAAYATGVRRHTPLFTLVKAPGASFKAAVIVSKKVAKKAHDRNRIRRRVYAVLASLASTKELTGTVLVQVKPALAALTKREFLTTVPEQIAQILNSQ